MTRQHLSRVSVLVLLAFLQLGCPPRGPDPVEEAMRLNAETRRIQKARRQEATQDFCAKTSADTAKTAQERDSVPLTVQHDRAQWWWQFGITPTTTMVVLATAQMDAANYVYRHREQTPEQLRVNVYAQCLEILKALVDLPLD